jgi:hypothetical protein
VAGQDVLAIVRVGIAKEGAMHAITTTSTAQTQGPADAVPPLHAVTPVDPAKSDSAPKDDASATRAAVVGPDQRMIEVHYEFDRVANLWVANLLDAGTGEVVRTVPATRILHQLAELQHPKVDALA